MKTYKPRSVLKALLALALPFNVYSMQEFIQEVKEEIGTTASIFSSHLGELIEGEQPAITNNKYKDRVASVTQSNEISSGERKYLATRLPIVRAALEKMLNRDLTNNHIPTIAFVCSGGGYRSMLCTTGSLCGAKKTHLLNAITYIATVSGSTWAVAPWISTRMPLNIFKNYIRECASRPLCDVTHEERHLIINMIAVKKAYDQPLTLVDIYGALLANRLLAHMNEKKQMTYLSNQANCLKKGEYPYPIYTAINGNEDASEFPSWYTFTPHKISNLTHAVSIPSWSYGRTFNQGTSTNNAPEQPLNEQLGTWGSAFAANWNTIIKVAAEREPDHAQFLKELKKFIKPIGKKRPLPFEAKIPNFTQGLENPINKHKNLQLVDAGIDINLPYPAVSGIWPERTPDILIFLDNSAGQVGMELKKCADFAARNNRPFPTINYENIDKKTISIFKDKQNSSTPLVIYMPAISDPQLWDQHKDNPDFNHYNLSEFDLNKEANDGFCETQCFQYSFKDSLLVTNQTEFNMKVSKDNIAQAIGWKIDHTTHL